MKPQDNHSSDPLSADLIQRFLRDRRRYMKDAMSRSGVAPYPTQYLRNMARSLSNSSSSPLALDSDDTEAPIVDTSKMTARFVITTSDRDRHGDIVIPRGCVNHLKNYTRNPRVFFAHNTSALPIASARDPEGNLALDILDDKIYSTAYFHGETSESEVVFRLIARKELQASSIGFLPIRASIVQLENDSEDLVDVETGEEIIDFRDSNGPSGLPSLRFLEWDMIEWSVVPIPANQEALAAHLSRGHVEGEKISPSIRRALTPFASGKTSTSVYFSEVPNHLPAAGPTPGIDSPTPASSPENKSLDVYTEPVSGYKESTKPAPECSNTSAPDKDIKEPSIVKNSEDLEIKKGLDALENPPAPGKTKPKDEDEEKNKAAEPDEDEEAAEECAVKEDDADEDVEKDEDGDDDTDEEAAHDESDEDHDDDEDGDSHTKILSSMSEILNSMHECSTAHTDLLKGIHDKLDNCLKALEPKDEAKNPDKEDEMKTLLSALTTLKSNQEALNRRLFEVTGRK